MLKCKLCSVLACFFGLVWCSTKRLPDVDVDVDIPEKPDAMHETGAKVNKFKLDFDFHQDLEYDQLRHQPRSLSRLTSLNPCDLEIHYLTKVQEMRNGEQFRKLRANSRTRTADQGHEALW